MHPLDRGLNTAILHIASRLFPCGYDVADNPPEGCDALTRHLNAGGRMIVWAGGSDATIYGDREVNYAFRAWHDFCHWRGEFDYSLRGEAATWSLQRDQVLALFGDNTRTRWWLGLLRAEIVGQGEYFSRYQRFPNDQRAFVTAYIADPHAALQQGEW
jgi:hypothetical protein